MDRRSMLTLTGTALATALTGCNALGSSNSTATPTDGGTENPTDTPASSPTADPTDSPTATPTDSPTPTPTDPGSDVPSDLVNGSFEGDWDAWSVGRYLPDDPNREDYEKVATQAGVTTTDSTDGSTACRLFIDGSQDDGTLWVQQPVDLSDYDYLAVDYRVSRSFNEIRNAAVYAGPTPDDPLVERDFDTSQSLEGHDAAGWKTFTYEVDHDGPGLVAVGWSIVWETGAAALLDNVRLSAEEPSTVTPVPGTDTEDGGSI